MFGSDIVVVGTYFVDEVGSYTDVTRYTRWHLRLESNIEIYR